MNTTAHDPSLKTTAGLWIDHRRAVIVTITAKEERTIEIQSHVERQASRNEGVRSTAPFESENIQADDIQLRKFTDHLNKYYAEVIDVIQNAQSILLFGPGEAKGELKKRLERGHHGKQIIEIETTDKMTDGQIIAKVREHFHV